MNISIHQARLSAEIEELASISEAEPPVVTRIVFTEPDLKKPSAWLKKRCEAAGLSVRHDAIGNIFIRWQGTDPNAPAVGTGSHIDAIPNAGKYDGVVGVLGGLEAIRDSRKLDSSRAIPSSFSSSPPRSPRALASAARAAACCPARLRPPLRKS